MSSSLNLNKNLTIHQILSDISVCVQQQKVIDSDLNALLEQRHVLEQELNESFFADSFTDQDRVYSEAKRMAIKIDASSATAQALSSKVQNLDLSQSRLNAALDRVESVIDLQQTIQIVKQALSEKNFQLAAKSTHKVLHVQQPIKNDPSYHILVGLESEVRSMVSSEYTTARDKSDYAQMLKCCSIYPLVNMHADGLCMYSQIVREKMEKYLAKHSLDVYCLPNEAVLSHTDMLARMLDKFSQTLEAHNKPIQQCFGKGSQVRLSQEFQSNLCDVFVVRLLHRFVKDRRLNELVKEVKDRNLRNRMVSAAANKSKASSSTSLTSSSSSHDSLDPRQLDALLEEIAIISREIEVFDSNLRHAASKAKTLMLKQISLQQQYKQQQQQQQSSSSEGSTASTALISVDSQTSQQQQQQQQHSWWNYIQLAEKLKSNPVHGLSSSSSSSTAATHATASSSISASGGKDKDLSNDKDKEKDNIKDKDKDKERESGLDLLHVSAMNKMAQELIGHYTAMEEYFMLQNVHKALRIDQHPGSWSGGTQDDATGLDRDSNSNSNSNSNINSVSGSGVSGGSGNGSGYSQAGRANQDKSRGKPGVLLGATGKDVGAGALIEELPMVQRMRTSLTSTLVDDVFYILKKCTERAFSTCSGSSACAVLNFTNTVLARDVKDVFVLSLADYASRYSNGKAAQELRAMASQVEKVTAVQLAQSTSLSGSSAEHHHPVAAEVHAAAGGDDLSGIPGLDRQAMLKLKADVSLLVTLNNMGACIVNIMTLKQHLDAEFDMIFTERHMARKMIQNCSDELLEISSTYEQILTKGIHIVAASITPHVRPLLDVVGQSSYDITEQQFAEKEQEGNWVQPFLAQLNSELGPLQKCLLDKNFNTLLSSLANFVVKRLEQHIFLKKFSMWGGLLLDKDVRQLLAYFSSSTALSLRDKFSRLIQIATLLQIERPSEVSDYIRDGTSGDWKLHETEVKKILALRSDFSPKDIAALVI
jgi:hypothetical protein